MAMKNDREQSTQEKRRAPRAALALEIEYGNLEQFCQDYARNVSLGGIFIETKAPLAVGTKISLSFRLPGYDGAIQTVGRVVRVVPEHLAKSEGLTQGMAVQFEDLSEQHKQVIDELVQRALDYC